MNLKTITAIAAISATVLTTGCSTVATPMTEATAAPESSYHMTPKSASPELATVVFVRDSGQLLSHYANYIILNGEKAATLATG